MKENRLIKVFGLLFVAVMILSLVQPGQAAARVPTNKTIMAQGPVSFHVSMPLRDINPNAYVYKPFILPNTVFDSPEGPFVDINTSLAIPRKGPVTPPTNPVGGNRQPPVPGAPVIDVPMPGLDKGWDGINQGYNRSVYGVGWVPPDTNGAASAFYYIQTVNNGFAVWDVNAMNAYAVPTNVYGPAKISSLWTGTGDICATRNDGDPIVLYDETAHRWLISQFAVPRVTLNYQCIAISATEDPLGTWNLYTYSFDIMNDYPHFGIWQDGYYMSMNQFSNAGAWMGAGAVVFERDAMLAGNPAARMIYIDTADACVGGTEPECNLGGMLPTDADGKLPPAGTPNYFVMHDDDAWGYAQDQLEIWAFNTNWTAGTATFTPVTLSLPVNAYDAYVCGTAIAGGTRNCIPQPGTTSKVDSIYDRVMYRFQFRDFSTPGNTDYRFVVNHTIDVANDPLGTAGVAGARWYELKYDGTAFSVRQQGETANDGINRWMGSIAQDKDGNMALGYSASDATTTYPVPRYTGRLAADTLGTMPLTESNLTTSALGSQSGSNRWGDYSMMDVGPDGCEFFYTNEYLRGTTSAEWYTRIGMFHMATCDGTPSTKILSGPSDPTSAQSATFTFTGVDRQGVVGYQCSIDGGSYATCASGDTFPGLTSGAHTFAVRAVDTTAQVDPNPATYAWTIADTIAPDTQIDSQPGSPFNSASATFTFSGTDNFAVTGFECSLDGSAYSTCTSPTTYPGLTAALHTFAVRAVDLAGNKDATPASFSWTITPLSVTVKSKGTLDGWTLESTATSSIGGSFSATGDLLVGDDAAKKQYRSILSFDTGAALPDGSSVLSATLRLKLHASTGSVSTLSALKTYISSPFFGTTAALKAHDFEAPALAVSSAGVFVANPWYSATIRPGALTFVSSTALTQFRVQFTKGNNANLLDDYLAFYSGDAASAANYPQLVIQYLLP